MKQTTRKKLKRALQCTLSLLLVAQTMNSSALAIHLGGFSLSDYITKALDHNNQKRQEEQERQYQELYGDDWEKVTALQPGESYIGEEYMYVCSEETYVDWKRVGSEQDLDPSGWGNEERLLLITDRSGYSLYLGNDYGQTRKEIADTSDQVVLAAKVPGTKRRIVSGITRDTSGNSVAEYVDEYVYPEMIGFASEKMAINSNAYPYPDTFRTLGTMNAPYIEYKGLDAVNGNQRKFNIIMSKDDGTKSEIALSHDDSGDRIQLRAASQCTGFTFYMKGGGLRIFENIEDDDDLQLRISEDDELYGRSYESLEEMRFANEFIIFVGEKTLGKRIETISLKLEDAEQNPEALENVYGGAIEFYRWEKVTSSSQLPTGSDTYRALLVWDDKYFLQGDDFRKHSTEDGMALYVNEEKKRGTAPGNVAEVQEIDLSQNEFYTMGGLGTPYIRFSGHKDKNESNDACPYYSFQLAGVDDQPSEKWLCDGDNVLDLCLGEVSTKWGGMDVGIIVGQEADDGNDAAPGKVKLFYNEPTWRDTGFMYSGNVLYGDDCGWDISEFTLYIGKPVVYPAVRQNYVVGEDQFMHISQNGAMFKNVTITVAKGGVLSIESWFMNNGRIIVDGGTLIVQNASNPLGDEEEDDTEDSVMLPFADIHPSVSGSLELQNGGELIVLTDARAVFSNIKARSGSSILNNGLLLAETINLQESTLENRKGMTMFVGYDFRAIHSLRQGSTDRIISDLTSRLNSGTACITVGAHSAVLNDGSIRYSTERTSEDDSVWNLGGGTYTKVEGKKSRYMLTK